MTWRASCPRGGSSADSYRTFYIHELAYPLAGFLLAYRNFSNRLNIALGLDDPENLSKVDPEFMDMLEAEAVKTSA